MAYPSARRRLHFGDYSGGFGPLYNAASRPKQAKDLPISIRLISIFPDTYLPGFASGGGEAYLGTAKAIGQIS